jgi:hypothetical protein
MLVLAFGIVHAEEVSGSCYLPGEMAVIEEFNSPIALANHRRENEDTMRDENCDTREALQLQSQSNIQIRMHKAWHSNYSLNPSAQHCHPP